MKLAFPRPGHADAAHETATGVRANAVRPAGARLGDGPARRPRAVVLLKTIAILLAVAGVLALADGILTLVWQEPVSGLLAHLEQGRLAQSLKRLEGARATAADERALAALPTDDQRIGFFARKLQQTARAGQAVGRIRIPQIGASFVVVAGTDEASLKKGPGIYAGTGVPGLRGTIGIAGHRTTYLAPFRRINELVHGDRITLEMPYGLFSYTVLGHRIVSPKDVSVLRSAPYDQVVLTACNPLYSAAQRIIVFARLTAAVPAGPALSPANATAPPALIPTAEAAGTILGDAVPGQLPPAGAPPIAPGEVLLGGTTAGPPSSSPARAPGRPRAAPGPRRGRLGSPAAAPGRPGAPRPAGTLPVRPPTPAPVSATPPSPVGPAPQAPSRPVVHGPGPAPTSRPPDKAPSSSRSPSPTSRQQQTRVQGRPGASAPIIAVPG